MEEAELDSSWRRFPIGDIFLFEESVFLLLVKHYQTICEWRSWSAAMFGTTFWNLDLKYLHVLTLPVDRAREFLESWPTVYSYLDFGLKNSSLRLPYQRPSSSADCARELFKLWKDSAEKIFLVGIAYLCEWHHKWSSFRVILAHVIWPRALPLGQSFSLKFSLETRL